MNKAIAKAFDITASIPASKIHYKQERFDFYGGFGNYRCKADMYGLECRALGGFMFQPRFFEPMYDASVYAVVLAHEHYEELSRMTLDQIKALK